MQSTFRPAPWLKGAHAQTIWASRFRKKPTISTELERVILPDHDFMDLHWSRGSQGPIFLILHGLQGSIDSIYIRGMIRATQPYDWNIVTIHMRGSGELPNLLPQTYHAGKTDDIAYIVNHIQQQYPNRPMVALGYSLGANVLLKWLGEIGKDAPIALAIAVSTPFELHYAIRRIEVGFSTIYQEYLLRKLRAAALKKTELMELPVSRERIKKIKTLREFDDLITAKVNGFDSAQDYYHQASCRPYLKDIRVKTLIIHALDDPFMTPTVVPTPEEVSDSVILEITRNGGHVGFVSGANPTKAYYWLEHRVPEFILQNL